MKFEWPFRVSRAISAVAELLVITVVASWLDCVITNLDLRCKHDYLSVEGRPSANV